MAKEIKTKVKLQVTGGQATPAPPVGPALGQHGVNIGQFVSQFNERTKDMQGIIVPVVVTIYADNKFDFITKKPPASALLKRAAEIAKGSSHTGKEKVSSITKEQLIEIAKTKMEDLNARDLDNAVKIIGGTARSMGIEIKT
ncbi:MAG: 50S ribosomal protein L11 [Planctomycetota bacterium]